MENIKQSGTKSLNITYGEVEFKQMEFCKKEFEKYLYLGNKINWGLFISHCIKIYHFDYVKPKKDMQNPIKRR